jgi:hypothetical protein
VFRIGEPTHQGAEQRLYPANVWRAAVERLVVSGQQIGGFVVTRSLTAAIALAATLGIAGLAQAQTTPAPVSPSAPGTVPATQGPGTAQTMEPAQTAEPAQTTEPAQSTEQAPASVSPATVQKAQEQLKSQGLYRGPADGRIGPATRTAVSRYQRKEGLPQTAMLDPPTLKHLLPGSFSDDSSTTPSR